MARARLTPADKAAKLFRDFHRRAPKAGDLGTFSCPEISALKVGKLIGMIYLADGDGQTYIHKFKVNRRPLLFVSYDGKHLMALGGAFRFTERGFVG